MRDRRFSGVAHFISEILPAFMTVISLFILPLAWFRMFVSTLPLPAWVESAFPHFSPILFSNFIIPKLRSCPLDISCTVNPAYSDKLF